LDIEALPGRNKKLSLIQKSPIIRSFENETEFVQSREEHFVVQIECSHLLSFFLSLSLVFCLLACFLTGYRDTSGSILHESKRDDHWGGISFGPGDVVGCMISLCGEETDALPSIMVPSVAQVYERKKKKAKITPASSNSNESGKDGNGNTIRFYVNGIAAGDMKRNSCIAFNSVTEGIYYPAVSSYYGGTVLANFGPTFLFPPPSASDLGLPKGVKVKAMSEVKEAPKKPIAGGGSSAETSAVGGGMAKAMIPMKGVGRGNNQKRGEDNDQITYDSWRRFMEKHKVTLDEKRKALNEKEGKEEGKEENVK
jgi:hypothetical protein